MNWFLKRIKEIPNFIRRHSDRIVVSCFLVFISTIMGLIIWGEEQSRKDSLIREVILEDGTRCVLNLKGGIQCNWKK